MKKTIINNLADVVAVAVVVAIAVAVAVAVVELMIDYPLFLLKKKTQKTNS